MNTIHPTAIVGPNVQLGDGIYIGAYSVIGAHAEYHGRVNERTDEPGRVVIGNGVTIREHVTIHGSAFPEGNGVTTIGNGCYIQAHAHIGHDATVGEDVTVACFAVVAGHVTVGKGSNLGLGAITHQHARIAEGCMIGAQAFVKGDTEPFRIYVGVPAKAIGMNERAIERMGG